MPEASTGTPVRFVMLGGFLGAGKTTALLRLARHYAALGRRVGVITNDQAEGLVDTLAFQEAGFTTEEIPAGCFCCHFEKLLEASGKLEDGLAPDVVLAEPVGSCTDLVNAVIAPLKKLYRDRFSVAPYAVLADPDRLMQSLSDSGRGSFSEKVTYLYKMQQNEADIVVLNKIDRLSAPEIEHSLTLLRRNFPGAAQLAVSALAGTGFDRLVDLLEECTEPGRHPADVDYKRYTEGEVALGWLNARVRLSSQASWDGDQMLADLSNAAGSALEVAGAEVAHFKMRLVDSRGREGAVHTTGSGRTCEVRGRLGQRLEAGDLIINLRAEAEPEVLREAVLSGLTQVALDYGLEHEVVQCSTFSPSAPVPPPQSRLTTRL